MTPGLLFPELEQASSVSPAAPVATLGPALLAALPSVHWSARDGAAALLHGDSLDLLDALPDESFDLVFADPPYFLSNGGSTCQNGRRVKVDKGGWDKSRGADENHEFNTRWLRSCQRLLKPHGSIWVSGTSHVIYSVGFAMQQLGFKMVNEIVWEKPNPPPNLACRCFTHSHETVLWAARQRKSKHHFAYARMREQNGGKQMKSVWRMTAPGKGEKVHGRHPTQKPLALLERVIEAACPPGGVVLDPFNGSGTTGVAATRAGHAYVGIDQQAEYLELTRRRITGGA